MEEEFDEDSEDKEEKEMQSFMIDFLAHGYNFKGYDHNKKMLEGVKIKIIDSDPTHVNFSEKSKDVDPEKFGEYTENKEFLDFLEKGGVPILKILTFPEFKGKSKAEVLQYVVDNYGKEYYLPGLEYMNFLSKKRQKIFVTDAFRATNHNGTKEERVAAHEAVNKAKEDFRVEIKQLNDSACYCSGSLLRGKSGKWYIPKTWWSNVNQGDPFYERGKAIGLQDEWKEYERVLVAERNNSESE